MLVEEDVLTRARKGDRDAIVEVLSQQYPASHRMAYAINGRADVGANIVAWVMKQSFRAIDAWKDDAAPQRWFRHHTLLTARRAAQWKPDAASDTLVREMDRDEASYVAFIRALRSLPQQQIEAFILTHGEGLDTRSTAVGMDCSTTAATNHLREAETRLRELSGADFETHVKRMREAYTQLAPSKDLAMSIVAKDARGYLWSRKIRTLVIMILMLAIMAALAYGVWRFRRAGI